VLLIAEWNTEKTIQTVFEPGFTTKKEAGIRIIFNKRIVEEYHRGSIKVSHSEIGKGTTMQISLKSILILTLFTSALFCKTSSPLLLFYLNRRLQKPRALPSDELILLKIV
jgi:hypothetical protein